jgi:fumarate reductase subunit D
MWVSRNMILIKKFHQFALRAWSKEETLFACFWGLWLSGTLIYTISLALVIGMISGLLFGLLSSSQHAAEWIELNQSIIELGAFILIAPFFLWSSMIVWRCAFNTSWKGWAYLARGFIFYCYAATGDSLIVRISHL